MVGSPIHVAVCGSCGRMGQAVVAALRHTDDLVLAAALEVPHHSAIGKPVEDVMVSSDTGAAFRAADVAIDFTTPDSSVGHAKAAQRAGTPLVIGTTGFTGAQLDTIKGCTRTLPVLLAPNMSLGMNLMYLIAARMTALLGPDYEVEIIEAHHGRKQDAPSGSARHLADAIAAARGIDPSAHLKYGRHGTTGPRDPAEIGVHSIRGGGIIGDHTVLFAGDAERLELTHRAQSRHVFAQGALTAARFLLRQPPGLYSFSDILQQRDQGKNHHDAIH